MSRFSKAEAESRGWAIVHEREERNVPTAAGEFRVIPGSYRAEKYLSDGTLINEEGETVGLLLERIAAKETQIESLGRTTTEAVIPEDIPRDEAGIEQRHVLVPAEPGNLNDDAPARYISDAELTTRSRTDAIYAKNEDGEPEMIFYRGTDAAIEADEAHEEQSAAVENARTAEPDVGDTEQVFVDDSQTVVDTPGGATGSVLVLRKDEDVSETLARRESDSADAESERVARQTEIGFNPAPEGEDKLAGVGVSIRRRAALGSEVPRQGETHDAAEAVLNPPEDVEPADTEPETAKLAEERQDAQEAKAQELTADKGVEADKPENAAQVLEAGTDAEQKLADDSANQDDSDDSGNSTQSGTAESDEPVDPTTDPPEGQRFTESSTEATVPEATPAAEELASEKHVDLSDVEGTGKDGKVTKPDVEKHLESDADVQIEPGESATVEAVEPQEGASAEGDSSATS